MKKILSILLFLSVLTIHSQEEASNWYFGNNAGLNFDTNTDTLTPMTDGMLATVEGCTTISDQTGNLLFYTDGTTVYDSSHSIMVNGTNLLGDESSTQSAIVVPKPSDPNIYYIFTVGSNNNPTGLNYYTVDISLNGGLGEVIGSNTNLLSACSEKISAVLKDCITGAIWVIAFSDASGLSNNNLTTFHAFEITNTGVNSTPIVSTLNLIGINDSRGYLKFSPDGSKLACANVRSGLFIADFDKQTGIVSNQQTLQFQSTTTNNPYGVEFSPNNQLLYVTASNDYFNQQDPSQNEIPSNHQSVLVQYDLAATDISNSLITIDQRQTYRGGLQLGPDGRIYRALSDTYNQGLPALSVINNPNIQGTGCNYQHATIDLGGQLSRQGLPPFITSFFSETIDIIQNGISTLNLNLCDGDTYTLMADDIPSATYSWTQDGNPLPETSNQLVVIENGNYEVIIQTNNVDCGTLEGQALVSYFEIPVTNQPNDILVCDVDNNGIALFDFSSQNSSILAAQDPVQFEVKYFETQTDADLNINEIVGGYNNISNPQTIYARLANIGNTNCYDTTSFSIEVFNTPSIANISDFEICDDDSNALDGLTAINLLAFNSEILGMQDSQNFSISYHNNQNDADLGENSLPDNYTNQFPNSETIFIRIENNFNTDCYATDSIQLNINPIPEAFNSNLFQCDEDGISDGFTVFNMIEASNVLTGNSPDRSTKFFLNQADAQSNINELDGLSYSNISNPQTIVVQVINTITNCINYSELLLEVSATQINDYTASPVCDELNSEDGLNTFNLNDFTTDILNGLPPGLDVEYYETYNDALLEQNALTSPYNNTTPYLQTLYVRAENDNACYGISEVLLTINPLPQIEDDDVILYCLNNYPEQLTINGGIINDSPNNYSYNWSTGESTIDIEVNEIGTYSVTITNTSGCSKTRNITIEPSNVATFENIEVVDGSLQNNTITILTSGEGEYQYALVNQEGEVTPYQESNVFLNIPPSIYTVLVRDFKNNCGVVDRDLSVIGFPLFFTPNGDSVNDTWQVYGLSSAFQPNSLIYIFDRYGKLITKIKASSPGWDGTLNGQPLPSNDYWFSVTLEDGRIYNNHFTLKR